MLLNKALCLTDLSSGQAGVLGNLNHRFEPEFCFTVLALNMDMHPRLLTGKEVEPEATLTENSRTHD
jgi:hypothetical protein